ncbi:UDP-N-acetylmuramate dehydrogenase [Nakamurella leprariae]|uniref:UDP-N-acetylenolpyruvoylglucosamine reductase n=1 Tax=Nakamurella leprariae TaxID=2803911 RepID=A0A938YDP7_9ACTN|nr:UDP-N-acetylmuramate dehydrogenase [Nakamurella leprariae]MBM9466537.1 UDP-N-acetylmuramate dehydrogenase [Nakamurella leprariae]
MPSDLSSTPGSAPGGVRLADLTTLRLGGPAPSLRTATTAQDVVDAVGTADRAGTGVLVVGGGSNLVVADAGVSTPVVRVAVPGFTVRPDPADSDGALVTIGAGVDWDEAVARTLEAGFGGLTPLSGIPGSTGATPVQNVGAYGTEVSDVLREVTVLDRRSGQVRPLTAAELQLGYRHSVLRGTDRAVVLDVTFALRRGPVPVRYAELARTLGVPLGGSAPAAAVRAAVLELRRAKGMVLEPGDPDTCSAGSFFTNPILDADRARDADEAIRARLGADVTYPAYPATTAAGGPGTKLSAAWLIDRAGFAKGHPGPGGRVAVSGKHTLALTNRGAGTTADLLELAREIAGGVRERFRVDLAPEPVFVGVRW